MARNRFIQGLLRDPWIRTTGFVTGAFILCWSATAEFLKADSSWRPWAEQAMGWTGATLVFVAVLSLHFGITILPSIAERAFWTDLRNAAVPWAAVMVLYAVYAGGTNPGWLRGADQFLYALYYVGLYLAIERRPHRMHRWRPLDVERRLSWPTVLFTISGLFTYFLFVTDWSWSDGSNAVVALFLLLDGYFTLRLMILRRSCDDSRWRTIYLFLILSTATIFFNDLVLTITLLGFDLPRWDMISEVTWKLPAIFLIFAARARHQRFLRSGRRSEAESGTEPEGDLSGPLGQTLFFCLLLPLAHHGGYAELFLNGRSREGREVVMVVSIFLLGALALYQYRTLEKTTARLQQEREDAEKALHRVEKNLQLRKHRRQMMLRLDHARRRFAKAFEICPDGLALSRLSDGKFIEVSPEWTRIFGYSRREALGKTSLDLELWEDGEVRTRAMEILQTEGILVDFSARYRRRSGEWREGILSASLIEIDQEKCLLSVTRDTSPQTLKAQPRAEESNP